MPREDNFRLAGRSLGGSGPASPIVRQNQYDQDGSDKPGDISVMKLHVCGLSFGRSSVLITVLHLDILQFVDLTLADTVEQAILS